MAEFSLHATNYVIITVIHAGVVCTVQANCSDHHVSCMYHPSCIKKLKSDNFEVII